MYKNILHVRFLKAIQCFLGEQLESWKRQADVLFYMYVANILSVCLWKFKL